MKEHSALFSDHSRPFRESTVAMRTGRYSSLYPSDEEDQDAAVGCGRTSALMLLAEENTSVFFHRWEHQNTKGLRQKKITQHKDLRWNHTNMFAKACSWLPARETKPENSDASFLFTELYLSSSLFCNK